MAARLARVMLCQYRAALDADHPNLLALMEDEDVKSWYFCVCNLPGPYAGGEYIFHLRAPAEFPQKPPEFSFLTPNGVFEPGGKICISIGEFHASDQAGKAGSYGWRPALGMAGFAREVVNGMIDPDYLGGGIRVANSSPAVKARLARRSVAHNRDYHARLVAAFADLEAAHPDHRAVQGRRQEKASMAVVGADFATVRLADLFSRAATALGPLWGLVAEGFAALAAASGGRAILAQVAGELCGAVAERDPVTRRVLALALDARLWWELRSPRARDAYARFVEDLPGACGGACCQAVPSAMAAVGAAPGVFPSVHAELSAFLRTEDIDAKAAKGRALAGRARAAAAACPVSAEASAPPPGGPGGAGPSGLTDEDLDELLGSL